MDKSKLQKDLLGFAGNARLGTANGFGLNWTDEFTNKVKQWIKGHEGLRLKRYNDSRGFDTIGYGHLNHEGYGTISLEQANSIFEDDFAEHVKLAQKIRGFDKLTPIQQAGLVNMVFNMGLGSRGKSGVLGFDKGPGKDSTIEALLTGDMKRVSSGIRNSAYYRQVKSNRAEEVLAALTANKKAPTTTDDKPLVDVDTLLAENKETPKVKSSKDTSVKGVPDKPTQHNQTKSTEPTLDTSDTKSTSDPKPMELTKEVRVKYAAGDEHAGVLLRKNVVKQLAMVGVDSTKPLTVQIAEVRARMASSKDMMERRKLRYALASLQGTEVLYRRNGPEKPAVVTTKPKAKAVVPKEVEKAKTLVDSIDVDDLLDSTGNNSVTKSKDINSIDPTIRKALDVTKKHETKTANRTKFNSSDEQAGVVLTSELVRQLRRDGFDPKAPLADQITHVENRLAAASGIRERRRLRDTLAMLHGARSRYKREGPQLVSETHKTESPLVVTKSERNNQPLMVKPKTKTQLGAKPKKEETTPIKVEVDSGAPDLANAVTDGITSLTAVLKEYFATNEETKQAINKKLDQVPEIHVVQEVAPATVAQTKQQNNNTDATLLRSSASVKTTPSPISTKKLSFNTIA